MKAEKNKLAKAIRKSNKTKADSNFKVDANSNCLDKNHFETQPRQAAQEPQRQAALTNPRQTSGAPLGQADPAQPRQTAAVLPKHALR